jgi:hypothetical protein
MLLFFSILFLLDFLAFLVRAYLLEPLVSSGAREVEPKADWPTTPGILDSQIYLQKKRWNLSRGGWFYLDFPSRYVDIHVTYLVNGTSYILRPPMSFLDGASGLVPSRAAKLTAKYPSGKRVSVRYDPAYPQHAVLVEDEF